MKRKRKIPQKLPKVKEIGYEEFRGQIKLYLVTTVKRHEPFLITNNADEVAKAYMSKSKQYGLKVDPKFPQFVEEVLLKKK